MTDFSLDQLVEILSTARSIEEAAEQKTKQQIEQSLKNKNINQAISEDIVIETLSDLGIDKKYINEAMRFFDSKYVTQQMRQKRVKFYEKIVSKINAEIIRDFWIQTLCVNNNNYVITIGKENRAIRSAGFTVTIYKNHYMIPKKLITIFQYLRINIFGFLKLAEFVVWHGDPQYQYTDPPQIEGSIYDPTILRLYLANIEELKNKTEIPWKEVVVSDNIRFEEIYKESL